MRAAINWSEGPITAQLAANYTGAYKNWSSTALNPVVSDAFGNPSSGGDHVHASTFVDLHISYDFLSGEPLLGEDEVFVDVKNLFDDRPPFFNSANGYNNYNSNPIGRTVSVGIQGKW
jgi:outer membrane receptor protein involved in Fe transport